MTPRRPRNIYRQQGCIELSNMSVNYASFDPNACPLCSNLEILFDHLSAKNINGNYLRSVF